MPFNDLLNINYPESIEELELKIYDITGQLVLVTQQINQQIKVSHLSSGLYIAIILDTNSQILNIQKIVKN